MAALPKLSAEQWGKARANWESDPREGFKWVAEWIGEELSVSVSPPAVSKTAKRDGWEKFAAAIAAANNPGSPAKVSAKVSKVSQSKEKPQKTIIAETIETLPKTTAGESASEDSFGRFTQLTAKQELFVRQYVVDLNGTQAAIRAGYSKNGADTQAVRLLGNAGVQAAIRELMAPRLNGLDSDGLIQKWIDAVSVDPNELTQYRRVCCPNCWGEGHARQYTPEGLKATKRKHDRDRASNLKASNGVVDIGEFPEYESEWYDKRKDPHPDCPECFGEGIGETFLHDTRNLSPEALAIYAGVKEGRDGIEILMSSREKAQENLAKALGIFREKEIEITVNTVNLDELSQIFTEKMRLSRERQARVLAERGIIDVQDVGDVSS